MKVSNSGLSEDVKTNDNIEMNNRQLQAVYLCLLHPYTYIVPHETVKGWKPLVWSSVREYSRFAISIDSLATGGSAVTRFRVQVSFHIRER